MTKSLALAALATTFIATAVAATPAHAGDGKDLLKFAPESSQIVMVFDMADSRDSALLQKGFKKLLDTSTEATAKLAELGLDPMKDIDTVMFAGGGATDLDADKLKDIVIIIEGRLPKDKLSTIPDVKTSTYAGVSIFTNDDTDAAFVGDRLFFTKKGKMKAAIDIALNTGKGKGKSLAASKKAKALRDAIAATDTNADLWMTVIVPAKAQKEMKADQGMVAKTVAVGFNFTADLGAAMKIGTDSAATAEKMVGMVQSQLPQILQGASAIGLTKAAKSLLVSPDAAAVNISFTMTEAELMALVNMARGFGGGMGGGAP